MNNGYSLVEKMRKVRREHKLGAYEQLLYYELVSICNKLRWPDEFNCSNTQLCKALNMSLPTVIKAREKLIEVKLICFTSGKTDWSLSAYSFSVAAQKELPFEEESGETTKGGLHQTTKGGLHETTKGGLHETTKGGLHSNKQIPKTPPISPSGGERENFRNSLLIAFQDIKKELLADEGWIELTVMRSGFGAQFYAVLPKQIDIFLQDMQLIGEENKLKTLSDAKKKFSWWWRNQGKQTYENNHANIEIW